MIFLINLNDADSAALTRACKERGVEPNKVLSAIVRESARAFVEERHLSLDNVLNPVGLAADLIRLTMNEEEFAAFCDSETTIDDMEDNFRNNNMDLVENPTEEAVRARKFIASLFLGNTDLTVFGKAQAAKVEVAVPDYVLAMRDVLIAVSREMTYKEIAEQCRVDLPAQAALTFSKLVKEGKVEGVSVGKNASNTNIYCYET